MPADSLMTHPMIHIAEKDLSVDFMSAIFGPVVDAIRNSGSAGGAQFTAATAEDSLLGSMMQVMNETMLFLAALYIVYITITHSLRLGEEPTGSEGMQIRGSSLWTPVRIPLAVSALLPYAGGYSFLQLLVLWLALNSVGAADTLHRVFVERLPAEAGRLQAPPPEVRADTQAVVEALIQMSSCAEAYNHAALRSRGGKQGEALMRIYRVAAAEPPSTRAGREQGLLNYFSTGAKAREAPGVLYQAGIPGQPHLRAVCGALKVSGAIVEGEKANLAGWFSRLLGGDETEKEAAALRAVYEAQRIALSQVFKEIRDQVRRVVWRGELYPADYVRAMARRYRDLISTHAGRELEALGKGVDLAATLDRGWLLSGAWPLGVITRQARIRGALSNLPQVASTVSSPQWQTLGERLGKNVQQAMLVPMEKTRALIQHAHEARPPSDVVGGEDDPAELQMELLQSLAPKKNEDPILALSAAGRKLLDSSAALAGGWGLAIAGASAISTAGEVAAARGLVGKVKALARGGGGAGFSAVAGVVGAIGTWIPLVIAGALLAWVVPLLPVLIWAAAAAGWFVLIIEAVIACVVWAVSWLRPEGDNPAGRGVQGWLLVLSVMLRPGLMLCGLAAAVTLSSVALRLAGALLAPVIQAIAGPGGALAALSGIVGTIVLLLAWAGLAVMVINQAFSLVHAIPDRILRWLGEGIDLAAERLDHTRTIVLQGLHQGGYGMAGVGRGATRRMLPRG